MNDGTKRSENIETLGYYVGKAYSNPDVVIHSFESPGSEAKLAMELVARWGSVAAKTEGEDSAGRAKLELQTPAEVVDRACETSQLTFKAFRERGWMLRTPSIEVATAFSKEIEKEDAANEAMRIENMRKARSA